MGPFATRQVILLPFPFSDLSATKLRPALLLAWPAEETGCYAKSPATPTPTRAP